ncbi:MAG TPA: phosphoribosylformylglycinamidine cyclo-ligase [Lautropia sp.]|nr:phosphoribosylformylglycinamidine cyclo-ligase [Lautropia sp.]
MADASGPDGPGSGLSYRDAGVDIDAGDALVARIKPLAMRTRRPGVLSGIGGFGGLFALPAGYREPILVSGTDGVGTKLKLAFALRRHDTIGIDLVAMSVNDILVQGAEPLFFLDYFACGKLDVDTAASVIGGIATGCEQSGCALLGGETAEMPGMYPPGEFDLAGFAVGVVERSEIVDGSAIVAGDQLVGLASSGPHSNGYSLIRRVLEKTCGGITAEALDRTLDGKPLTDWIMAPTRIYVRPVLSLIRGRREGDDGAVGAGRGSDRPNPVKGMAHVTGGGLLENVPRMLPPGVQAVIRREAWEQPAIFRWLQAEGGIADLEMHRVFNCGIGMVLAVAPADLGAVMHSLLESGEHPCHLGSIVARDPGAPATVLA